MLKPDLFRPTATSSPMTVPALLDHVGNIIDLGAKPKMGRVYTAAVVAMMKDEHAERYGSIMNNPRCDMSPNWRGRMAPPVYLSVTKRVLSSKPTPAPFPDVDFLPKTLQECRGKPLRGEELLPIVRPLDQVHFDCVTLRAVTGRAGAIFNGGNHG